MKPAVHQPVDRPTTLGGFNELLARGVLIDMAGRTLVSRSCPYCGRTTLGETCPMTRHCPTCQAEPGQRCTRPSGHDADTHQPRTDAAEAVDKLRQLAGDPAVPAPWPGEATAVTAPPPVEQEGLW